MSDSEFDLLLLKAAKQDRDALDQLFSKYRDRLKRMVQLRLNRRLQGRVDDSDVVQEALLDASCKLAEYASDPQLPFFIWLRHITWLKLAEIHRRHLGTQKRDARQEISLHRGGLPSVDSVTLAANLIGNEESPSRAAIAAEQRIALQQSLNEMDAVDRELISLKHFEQLTIDEISQVLEMARATVGRRYLQAMVRLRTVLKELPEFDDM